MKQAWSFTMMEVLRNNASDRRDATVVLALSLRACTSLARNFIRQHSSTIGKTLASHFIRQRSSTIEKSPRAGGIMVDPENYLLSVFFIRAVRYRLWFCF